MWPGHGSKNQHILTKTNSSCVRQSLILNIISLWGAGLDERLWDNIEDSPRAWDDGLYDW